MNRFAVFRSDTDSVDFHIDARFWINPYWNESVTWVLGEGGVQGN